MRAVHFWSLAAALGKYLGIFSLVDLDTRFSFCECFISLALDPI